MGPNPLAALLDPQMGLLSAARPAAGMGNIMRMGGVEPPVPAAPSSIQLEPPERVARRRRIEQQLDEMLSRPIRPPDTHIKFREAIAVGLNPRLLPYLLESKEAPYRAQLQERQMQGNILGNLLGLYQPPGPISVGSGAYIPGEGGKAQFVAPPPERLKPFAAKSGDWLIDPNTGSREQIPESERDKWIKGDNAFFNWDTGEMRLIPKIGAGQKTPEEIKDESRSLQRQALQGMVANSVYARTGQPIPDDEMAKFQEQSQKMAEQYLDYHLPGWRDTAPSTQTTRPPGATTEQGRAEARQKRFDELYQEFLAQGMTEAAIFPRIKAQLAKEGL